MIDVLAQARLRLDPRKAILEDAVICLVCWNSFRQITNSHLAAHQTTTRRYKAQWGYNRRQPLMAKSLAGHYLTRAISRGLAGLIRQRPIIADPKLRVMGGIRTLRLQERLNRKDVRRRVATA